MGYAMILIMAITAGCGPGSGSSRGEEPEAHREEILQHTLFTPETEFFIEHPVLVAGEEAVFLIHATRLDSYRPYDSGTLTLQMGGWSLRLTEPDRPGIFSASFVPQGEGESELLYSFQSGDVTASVSHPVFIRHTADGDHDVHEHQNPESGPGGHIHGTGEAHQEEQAGETIPGGPDGGEVLFFKETAWESNFMVQQLDFEPFSSVLRSSGEILAVPGEKKNVAANSGGMVVFADRRLVQGSLVQKGQHLFTIQAGLVGSDNFELRYHEYLNRLNNSRNAYHRHRVLYERDVIPEKQYLESRTEYVSDSIRFYDLAGKAGKDGLIVTAPSQGFIHHLNVTEGEYVEAGQLLVTISSDKKLLLRADIPQQHYNRMKQVVSAHFRPAFSEKTYTLEELGGRLLARGSSVAENDHYIPLYFEVENDGTLLEGAFAEFYLLSDRDEERLTVPETAILEEQGNHYVYLQVSGERYTRRAIEIGDSNGIRVEVSAGLTPGDRVVTRGAMLLKSASMVTGEADHGHAH